MNKTLSPPTGSVASSETSESQSTLDDYQTALLTRATKNWKKIKEISEKQEKKRPPWRVVSVSTLPKADTSALLRAKLLDATRRMRAGKCQVATQTDNIPTKLMKEVNVDIQSDLIPMVDKEILTDGTITLQQEGPGEFVLTHSVAQMTDNIRITESQTQTTTPRISNTFFEEYFNKHNSNKLNGEIDDHLNRTERRLIEQMQAIRKIDEKLYGQDNGSDNGNNGYKDDGGELSDDSLLENSNGLTYSRKRSYKKPSNFFKPTISSWQFDFSAEDENALRVLPRREYSEDIKSWNSFKDMVIGKKLANMKLLPIPPRKSNLKKKSIIWSDIQHNAVAELINEANALLDVFDNMSILLGPDLYLNDLPKKDDTEIKFLSEYWEPILKESSQIINSKLNTLKNPEIKKVQPLSPEYIEKLL